MKTMTISNAIFAKNNKMYKHLHVLVMDVLIEYAINVLMIQRDKRNA